MKTVSVADLANITGAASSGNTKGFFTGVSIDSRTIKPGDCFFAVPGEKFDGHHYLQDAFSKGAACAVVSEDIDHLAGRTILRVDDTIRALGDFAAEYRRRMNFRVIAITGSVGKTTTRQIIHHVLSRHLPVFQAPASFNNNIGVPLTLLGARPQDKIVVAELGSNHPGEIAGLTRIALPDIALVTNVHPSHLAGFGNLQTIVKEKLSISEGLVRGGVLIINTDCDSLVNFCRAKRLDYVGFGADVDADFRAVDIVHNGSGSTFSIAGVPVHLPLPGPGNVENALAAWAVCSHFELTAHDFARAVESIPPVSMRAELLQIGTLTVLADCYNANPASMQNALEILSNIDPAGKRRLVFVCGDMAELGQQSRYFHAQLGALAARTKVQLLLAVGEYARVTAGAAEEAAEDRLQTVCFDDAASVCNNLDKFVKQSDIILVKGSRVTGLETVVERLRELFS
ncbi:MAG TPA: UDP-N-acetylmuramoyl-tripeptide--D-alanyl-D-alanine ligase [Sedimentisphaerales bacterium]|nr:UDP-N-acetylmuramoyl-tripeptide--D-alanyl-D-alanine ligase [Sedimentisphaerales bacterium]